MESSYKEILKTSFSLWNLSKNEEVANGIRDGTKMPSFGSVFSLYLVFFSIYAVLYEIFVYSLLRGYLDELSYAGLYTILPDALAVIVSILMRIVFGVLFYLFILLWSHMWIKVFGGDRDLKTTVSTFITIIFPSLLITYVLSFIWGIILAVTGAFNLIYGIVGIISFIVGAYYIIVVVKTFGVVQNLGASRAFGTGVVSTLTLVVLFIILLGIIYGILLGIMSVIFMI